MVDMVIFTPDYWVNSSPWPVFGPILGDLAIFLVKKHQNVTQQKRHGHLSSEKTVLSWVSLGVLLPLFVGIVVSIHYGHYFTGIIITSQDFMVHEMFCILFAWGSLE